MRNFFFYAPRDSQIFRQIEEILRQMPVSARLITLPPGSQFTAPACLELRSNDVVILFAEHDDDIEQLLTLSDEYMNFRILLVMPRSATPPMIQYRLLTPRLLVYLDDNLNDLFQYLQKTFK